jgi:hypothetical protein
MLFERSSWTAWIKLWRIWLAPTPMKIDLDFKPVKPREGFVSELVKAMRGERSDSISGQQRDS